MIMGKKSENKTQKSSPDQKKLRKQFEEYSEIRRFIVLDLKEQIENILEEFKFTPVVSERIKNFKSFFNKYLRLNEDNENPKINDLIGIRIICPFLNDINIIQKILEEKFIITEVERKEHSTFKEFGYESVHLLVKIPENYIKKYGCPGTDIFEIQIRTILQDAWAEVEHELIYKTESSPFDEPMKRKLAAVNASLSLADIIFQEIRIQQRQYNQELDKRRTNFYQMVEALTDEKLIKDNIKTSRENSVNNSESDNVFSSEKYDSTIDKLLIDALSAHNDSNYKEAINLYTKILESKLTENIRSIICKHRGMAYFACSKYEEAIVDFTSSQKHDPKSYRSAYYKGVVRSVLEDYSKAIDDYTVSLEIKPYQPFCLFRRAQSFYHIGDYPAALADIENSLALDPENQSAAKLKDILLDKLKM